MGFEITTEVFPVRITDVTKLYAYRLNIKGDISTVGGKLSYRLRKTFPGHWVWTAGRILTDTRQEVAKIMEVVRELWNEQPKIFGNLLDIVEDSSWQSTSQMVADFVARGLFTDIDAEIRRVLAQKSQDLGNARVERVYDVRGWVVQNQPAVSISISSRLVYKQDLKQYIAARSTAPEDLKGLLVADKSSSLKGEIAGITGKMNQHRERLLAMNPREETQELIEKAPDDELIISVKVERGEYDYPASALRIIVRTEDFTRFGISSQQALKALRLEPGFRFRLVKEISDIAKKRLLINNAYSSQSSPALFITGSSVAFKPRFCFGGGQSRVYDEKSVLRYLRECGLYKRASKFVNTPIRLGIVNALPSTDLSMFITDLKRELAILDFKLEVVSQIKTQSCSQFDLEKAIGTLQNETPDILLSIVPDEYGENDEEWGAYHRFKSLTVGQGIASQFVHGSTLGKKFATANIILGLLGKTGNIPFILAEPMPYADLVVGIDIARERKQRLPGSINATAITRIYFGNGEFLRYVIHDAPLEGETIPENILQGIFPVADFKGKKVVIHRDGYFRGDEKRVLLDWARKLGAIFYLVEVIKTGTPRLYALQDNVMQRLEKGHAFRLNDTNAFLVSSPPPFMDATAQPLRIQTQAPFTIEQAIHSILSMTLLHYGSLRPPRLPVTIHYSDKIAYLALRGIKPKNLEGNIPFWL